MNIEIFEQLMNLNCFKGNLCEYPAGMLLKDFKAPQILCLMSCQYGNDLGNTHLNRMNVCTFSIGMC